MSAWFADLDADLARLAELTRRMPDRALSLDFPRHFGRPVDAAEVYAAWGDLVDELPASPWLGEALSLYVHVPLCDQRCRYCMYPSRASRDTVAGAAFVAGVERELRTLAGAVAGAPFRHSYVGGGTPTLLTEADLARLLGALRTTLPAHPAGQHTVECNPATTTRAKLALMRAHGVNRVSFGVQSFEPAVLAASGRAQSRAAVETAVAEALACGFPDVNVDLIAGLPGDDAAGFSRSLGAALALRPTELTLYRYQQPTPAAPAEPPAALLAALHAEACAAATRAGYALLGQPRPDDLLWKLHRPDRRPPELPYTRRGLAVLGLGPGAESHVFGRLHYARPLVPAGGAPYTGYAIDRYEDLVRQVLDHWQPSREIRLRPLQARFGRPAVAELVSRLEWLRRLGRAEWRGLATIRLGFESYDEALVLTKLLFPAKRLTALWNAHPATATAAFRLRDGRPLRLSVSSPPAGERFVERGRFGFAYEEFGEGLRPADAPAPPDAPSGSQPGTGPDPLPAALGALFRRLADAGAPHDAPDTLLERLVAAAAAEGLGNAAAAPA